VERPSAWVLPWDRWPRIGRPVRPHSSRRRSPRA